MTTDELIADLSARAGEPRPNLSRAVLAALALGGAVSLAIYLPTLGFRPDFAAALEGWRFPVKVVLCAALFAAAFHQLFRLSRPIPAVFERTLVALLAAALGAAVLVELVALPSALWGSQLIGRNALVCLASIPALSLPVLLGLLVVLRTGAPASPMLAGIAAGALAAGFGATLYALHCPDDSPLFVLVWYGLACTAVIALGGALGRRALSW